jgi:hypothetical protein
MVEFYRCTRSLDSGVPARTTNSKDPTVLRVIDPRYEWSIFSGPRIQTLPSLLLIGSKKLADGKLW